MTTSISLQTTRNLREYLHGRQEEMINLLAQLVNAESPSSVPTAQKPILTILRQEWRQRGYRVRYLPGKQTGGHLLGIARERRPQQPYQLLLGHCDTVWPLGTLEQMPLKIHQGKLFGPGAYDMKAGLVLTLFALEAITALELSPEVSPVLFINSDEEIGSWESTPYIQRLAQKADRALVMEPSLGLQGKLKTQRKGVGRFVIRAIGQAAHAGLDPEKGISAILELTFIVQQLFALNDPQRGITVNVGTIDGGLRPNVIAPEAKAVVDVRVPSPDDAQRIETAIRSLQPTTTGSQIIVEGRFGRPPMVKNPGSEQLWLLAQEIGFGLGLKLEETTAGGGSDGNTTSLYTATLDGLGAVGDGAHAIGEFVSLEQMVDRAALLAGLISSPSLSI
ncbi:MAG: M20 family metallopeptidase [Xenococcaceae cyanobacterium MO_167.B27]|nr:M20 family metallopeptidase [Xenococcaceae cyanobacterium MO_167.B27]